MDKSLSGSELGILKGIEKEDYRICDQYCQILDDCAGYIYYIAAPANFFLKKCFFKALPTSLEDSFFLTQKSVLC